MNDRREDSEDEFGRDPPLATEHGRITRSSIRRIIYRVTSPCYRGAECPRCEGRKGVKCPEAVSPHSIRRGSITHFLANDVPAEIVSDRMNVGQRILDEHYDGRSEDVKLEQRRGYRDNIQFSLLSLPTSLIFWLHGDCRTSKAVLCAVDSLGCLPWKRHVHWPSNLCNFPRWVSSRPACWRRTFSIRADV